MRRESYYIVVEKVNRHWSACERQINEQKIYYKEKRGNSKGQQMKKLVDTMNDAKTKVRQVEKRRQVITE